jgi:hypothetical protein
LILFASLRTCITDRTNITDRLRHVQLSLRTVPGAIPLLFWHPRTSGVLRFPVLDIPFFRATRFTFSTCTSQRVIRLAPSYVDAVRTARNRH